MATSAARNSGIAGGKSSYVTGRQDGVRLQLSGNNRQLPPAGSGVDWRDHRPAINTALKAWRSNRDDRILVKLHADISRDLMKQALVADSQEHPAGLAASLAEERAGLLVTPPKSITVGERVERVTILDSAIARLRLTRRINETQYRAALVDVVAQRRRMPSKSKAPVTWLPDRPVGAEEETASVADSNRKIKVRYRLVDLSEPVVSNTPAGGLNPAYDQRLQPRRRDRAASRAQIERLAVNLAAGELLKPDAGWADGPPLVGPDGLVESGNGRLLALRRAVSVNPQGVGTYRRQLADIAPRFGFMRTEVAQMVQPVLVRERLTELDMVGRQRLVHEANAGGMARMGAAEQARADATLIPSGFFTDLDIADSDRSLAEVLGKKRNTPVVVRFLNLLPKTEQTALVDRQGRLSTEGVNRLERAMFAYALPGAAGERLAWLVFEEGEAIDRLGAGLKQALPKLGQMEDLIRAGQRDAELSLGDDLAKAVEKMRDIHRQGLSVDDYLRQHKLFDELSPLQEQLMLQLAERRRSGRAVAGLINAYADLVLQAAPPSQTRLVHDEFEVTREDLLRIAVRNVGGVWVNVNPEYKQRVFDDG